VDCGSIRAAARALNLSQAALTKSLRLLEDSAGLSLMVRKSSGVVLTPAGQRLLARARLVTRQLDLADTELRDAADEAQSAVCVGLTPYLTLSALGEAYRGFRTRFPHTRLEVMEGLVARVLPALRDGTLDFAIVAGSGDVPPKEFVCEHLQVQPQKIGAREGHPLHKPGSASAKALAACEWVVTRPLGHSAAGDDSLTTLFAQAGLPPPRAVAQCDAMAAISLVRNTDALCLFPLPLLNEPESRGIRALASPALQPMDIDLVQLSLPDAPLTAAAAWLAHCLRDAALRVKP
jgi:DNA-binding transcriptional LysR family regulator